ncbi:hypothetical protein EGR_10937 [Echinococcus granulosus]|uniref:Uncharacterized protein n=1 Tax=Echinococcus granulosus TaxID=6210 RepID=W6U150_ECHGR|nr:hypothetical protein EGR_10937 [Echinococcus granulosus]EUB54201.1 hypothetical protein EGR_10937 [Echinococcus granulosus]
MSIPQFEESKWHVTLIQYSIFSLVKALAAHVTAINSEESKMKCFRMKSSPKYISSTLKSSTVIFISQINTDIQY